MSSQVKELLQLFRAAAWVDTSGFDALLAGIGPLQAGDLAGLLESVLTSRELADDSARQQRRCLAFSRLAENFPDRQLFVPYVRALRFQDAHLRSVLVSLLPPVNSVSDHGELCELLRSDDAELRRLAASVMERVGSRMVCETLAGLVSERGFQGRIEAMQVLQVLAGHRGRDAFEAVLNVGSAPERLSALDHLASPACLGKEPERALAALASAFADPDEAVQQRAIALYAAKSSEADFFNEVGPYLDHTNPRVATSAVRGLRHARGPAAIESLRKALRRGPNLVRLEAVEVLEAFGSAEALGPLVDALGQRQVVVRQRAGQALASLCRSGKIELARTVLWLLRSRDVNVRRMAVEVAHSVPDPEGTLWPKLVDYLYDEAALTCTRARASGACASGWRAWGAG